MRRKSIRKAKHGQRSAVTQKEMCVSIAALLQTQRENPKKSDPPKTQDRNLSCQNIFTYSSIGLVTHRLCRHWPARYEKGQKPGKGHQSHWGLT